MEKSVRVRVPCRAPVYLLAIQYSAVSMVAESEKVVEIVTDIGFFSYHRKPHPVFGEESILDHTTK